MHRLVAAAKKALEHPFTITVCVAVALAFGALMGHGAMGIRKHHRGALGDIATAGACTSWGGSCWHYDRHNHNDNDDTDPT